MLTQIVLVGQYLGPSFVANNGKTYYLCDGQPLDRLTNEGLSSVWPVGAYGSTADDIHLPPLEGLYLRGYDFGSGRDSEASSRIPLSGVLPTEDNVGAFQPANMESHIHTLGSMGGAFGPCADGAGQDGGSSRDAPNVNKTANVGAIANTANTSVIVSGTLSTEFDVANCSFWVYIEGL